MSNYLQNPLKGEIWLTEWNSSRGSEQRGIRPSIIIQSDKGNLNPNFPNTITLAISTKGRKLPFHIELFPNSLNGLSDVSYAKCEQILTTSKERLIKKLGKISSSELDLIENAVKDVLDFY